MDEKNIDKLAKAEQNAYMKIWRSKNKDKVRQNNMRYWQKRALQNLNKKEGGANYE